MILHQTWASQMLECLIMASFSRDFTSMTNALPQALHIFRTIGVLENVAKVGTKWVAKRIHR